MIRSRPEYFSPLDELAELDFYRQVNPPLLDHCHIHPGQTVVDLGCGTGNVTAMLAQRMQGATGEIIAIDPSPDALELARQKLSRVREPVIRFLRGSAENLSRLVRGRADAVIFCNAIHLVRDKLATLREVAQALKPRGLLAFNSTFFAGAEPPESLQFYRRWMLRALRALKTDYGTAPARGSRAAARQRVSPDEYQLLLDRAGFAVERLEVVQVKVPVAFFRSLSGLSDFMEGVLPGVAYETAGKVLARAATETFQELGLQSSPRGWLLVVAQRQG